MFAVKKVGFEVKSGRPMFRGLSALKGWRRREAEGTGRSAEKAIESSSHARLTYCISLVALGVQLGDLYTHASALRCYYRTVFSLFAYYVGNPFGSPCIASFICFQPSRWLFSNTIQVNKVSECIRWCG